MKINPGPKGLIPWTEAEKSEGLRLSQCGLSPVEVYSCLMIERIKGYEAALKNIATQKTTEELKAEGEQEYEDADFEGGYDALIHIARRSIQPVT